MSGNGQGRSRFHRRGDKAAGWLGVRHGRSVPAPSGFGLVASRAARGVDADSERWHGRERRALTIRLPGGSCRERSSGRFRGKASRGRRRRMTRPTSQNRCVATASPADESHHRRNARFPARCEGRSRGTRDDRGRTSARQLESSVGLIGALDGHQFRAVCQVSSCAIDAPWLP